MITRVAPRLPEWSSGLLRLAFKVFQKTVLRRTYYKGKAMPSRGDITRASSERETTSRTLVDADAADIRLDTQDKLFRPCRTHSSSFETSTSTPDVIGVPTEAKMEQLQELIPGLPDDLVLDCILTRVSWLQLTSLSSVSRSWCRTLQSRAVHDARMQLNMPQKLVAVLHKTKIPMGKSVQLGSASFSDSEDGLSCSSSLDDRFMSSNFSPAQTLDELQAEYHHPEAYGYGLSLHDPEDNSWVQLPSIPSVGCGVPLFSELACFNGMLFVLGGRHHETWQPLREVFMLDLVSGNGLWQERASMITPRASFGCGVIGNKLYVAGGHSDTAGALSRAEVYDPERNVWEPIADMGGARSCCKLAVRDEKMYVIGGYALPAETDDEMDGSSMLSDDERVRLVQSSDDEDEEGEWANSAQVYDVGTGEWNQLANMKTLNDYDEQACTVFGGDLYSFSVVGVEKFDSASGSWKQVYNESWFMERKDRWLLSYADGTAPCLVLSVAAVDKEIFAMVCMGDECDRGCTLLKSKGFGKPGPKLSWERALCPVNFLCAFPALCTVEV